MTRDSVTLHDVTRAAVALVASCALWLVVSGDERGAVWIPVTMELSEGSAQVLMLPNPVRALVTGRRRDFIRLLQSPPMLRREITRNAADSARVELRPVDIILPQGTEARVTDLQPRTLVLPPLPSEHRT